MDSFVIAQQFDGVGTLHALRYPDGHMEADAACAHRAGPVEMGALDLYPLAPDKFLIFLKRGKGFQFHVKIHDPGEIVDKVFKFFKEGQGDENHEACDDRAEIKADSESEADTGGGPQPGRGSQPLDLLAAGYQNGPDPQKADACYDLGAHTGRIRHSGHGLIDVLVGKHGKGGPHTDEDMGAEACGMFVRASFQTDDAAENHCKEQPESDRKDIDIIKVIRQNMHEYDLPY